MFRCNSDDTIVLRVYLTVTYYILKQRNLTMLWVVRYKEFGYILILDIKHSWWILYPQFNDDVRSILYVEWELIDSWYKTFIINTISTYYYLVAEYVSVILNNIISYNALLPHGLKPLLNPSDSFCNWTLANKLVNCNSSKIS